MRGGEKMKKLIAIFVGLFILSFLVSGCQKKQAAETPQPPAETQGETAPATPTE